MNHKLNVILCSHGHLPSGACEVEFETLYNTGIKPLISALNKFPKINMVFHYSGVILNWIERRHPEFFMLLEELLNRKQAELLGGGFYHPILPLLPLTDKIGQIEMLTTYLRKQFGKRPTGCLIPAMAWEQNLVGPLNSCGMSYTFLEDEQFSGSGIRAEEGGIYSPCITEDQGKLIMVFPMAGAMGRELSKGEPLKILEELLDRLPKNGEEQVIVFPVAAAEQRFASRDSHAEAEYEKLFEAFSNADLKVKLTLPSKIYKNLHFLRKNYFSGVWTLGHNSGKTTQPAIHPRQFLVKHPEAGGIYAKMIHVHTLINNQLRGDKTRKRTALEELWKAQDSGIFRLSSPGLFHSPVRKAAYRSLLEAEKITGEKRKITPSLSVFDFDLDGEGEYIFQDDKLNCCIKSRGACVFELDYFPCAWNYLDTMASGEVNLNGGGERRYAFADWLAPANKGTITAEPDGIQGGRFCGNEEYEVSEIDRPQRRVTFTLPPKAGLPCGEIEIVKTWQLKKNSISLEYVLKNSGEKTQSFIFSPSVDLSFSGEGENFLKVLSLKDKEGEKETIALNSQDTIRDIKIIEFQDIKNEAVVSLELNRGFDARIFHIRAGLSGREEYQSTCLMPLLSVSLDRGKTWKASFSLKINS
jgi:hypothetical protein